MQRQNLPANINELIETITKDKLSFQDQESDYYTNRLINLVNNANGHQGKLNDQDYISLVIWANKKYDTMPQLLITLLSNTVGGHFDNANSKLYEIANKQGKVDVVKRLTDHSSFLHSKMEKASIVEKLITELSQDKYKQHATYPSDIIAQLKNDILPNLFSTNFMAKTQLSDEDYSSLLRWVARNGDESTLAALIVFTEKVNQEKLSELKKLFIVAINQPVDAIATCLYRQSAILQQFSDEFNSELKLDPLPMLHCSLLQFAAAKNCPELCNTLLEKNKSLKADSFLNNCLHFAASSGNAACYDLFLNYAKHHQLGWETQQNIFGHLPSDYLPENRHKLQRLEQTRIIDKLIAYIKLTVTNDDPTFKLENLQNGLCQGLSFFSALQTLKKQHGENINTEIINTLLSWDGKLESLNNKLNNPILEKQGFKTNKDVISYMTNHALFLQHSTMMNLLNISKYDYPTKYSFINQGKEKLLDVTDYVIPDITKQEIMQILQEHTATPNTLIAISLASDSTFCPTHAVTITIDNQGLLHFNDPNLPYAFPAFDPNDNAKMQALVEFLNNYNLNDIRFTVGSTYVFKYEPAQAFNQKYSLSKFLLTDILKSRTTSPMDLIRAACTKDAPDTVLSLLSEHKTAITDDNLCELLHVTIGHSAYRCCDILANQFSLSLSDIEKKIAKNHSASEVAEMMKNYENHLVNRQTINRMGR